MLKNVSIWANCIYLLCSWLLQHTHTPIEMKMSVNESEWNIKKNKAQKIHIHMCRIEATRQEKRKKRRHSDIDHVLISSLDEMKSQLATKGRKNTVHLCCMYIHVQINLVLRVFSIIFIFVHSSILWLRRCSRIKRLFLCGYVPTIDMTNSIDFAPWNWSAPYIHTHYFFCLCVCVYMCLHIILCIYNNWPFISLELKLQLQFIGYFFIFRIWNFRTAFFDQVASGNKDIANFFHQLNTFRFVAPKTLWDLIKAIFCIEQK